MRTDHFSFQAGICLLTAFVFFGRCANDGDKGSHSKSWSGQNATRGADTSAGSSRTAAIHHVSTVEIKGMKFNPAELTMHKGDTVVWVNNDLTSHCVMEANKKWTSSTIASGRSWKKVVTENTEYYCAIHVVMKGRIKVE